MPGKVLLLSFRVALEVGAHQFLDADARVALGGRERRVAEQLLDRADVGSGVQQVGGKSVAQRMGAHAAAHPGLPDPRLQHAGDAAACEPPPPIVEEQCRLVFSSSQQLRPAGKVIRQRTRGGAPEDDVALLTPLAGNSQAARFEVQRPRVSRSRSARSAATSSPTRMPEA